MISFTNTRSYPRAMMIHSLYTHSTIIAMACSIGTKYIASSTEFKTRCHLAIGYNVRYDNIVMDYMIAFGNRYKLLINFITIFLNRTETTIFWINPGSCRHRFIKVQKLTKWAIKSTYRAPNRWLCVNHSICRISCRIVGIFMRQRVSNHFLPSGLNWMHGTSWRVWHRSMNILIRLLGFPPEAIPVLFCLCLCPACSFKVL